jgi:secondary thiamine-phosphate synthase enzyme
MPAETIEIQTNKRTEFLNITGKINEKIKDSGIEDGILFLFLKHTTTALIINENEHGLLADMEETLQRLIPELDYKHDRIDNNADSHLKAILLGNDLMLPIKNSKLELGTWQRIFLLELDGPRKRELVVKYLSV